MHKVIDCHCHILPGIDDGSASVEESIAMLQMEADQGIEHVIATPHFYPRHDTPERFLRRRYESEMRLREAMEKYSNLPKVSVGAEVYFFPGISESDLVNQLTIGKKSCMLLEMPQCLWTERMYREIENIYVRQGVTPVMAHVDRYISPLRTHGIPEHLKELPVLVQANASFFLKASTRRMALRMLREGRIHVLGSDSHNLSNRKPNLGDALGLIHRQFGEEAAENLGFYQNMILETI